VGEGTVPVLWAAWEDNCGVSYSQPLILKGWGNYSGQTIAVVSAGKELRGYLMKEPDFSNNFQPNPPIWKVPLHGDKVTKSHPTLVEKDGKKYVYIGTERSGSKSYIDVIDITDFDNAKKVFHFEDLRASDIVSAPLVLNWRGHEVVVYTAGNSAEVRLATDMLDQSKANNLYISLGSGRTSSSPAPILNGQGFAVGLDQGQNSGELRLYRLDDILAEENGKVVLKSHNAYKRHTLSSGLVASFAVDGDWLYFGDCQSRVYGLNVVTGEFWVNADNKGIFSNRSPALTGNTVYFPAVGQPGQRGKILAIDRNTHQTNWTVQFDSRAMTAPAVWRIPSTGGATVFEGVGNGWLSAIDPFVGVKYHGFPIASANNTDNYGAGVTGEISLAYDWMVVTTQDGVKAWKSVPFNLVAVELQSGVEEGAQIEKGKTYLGSFKVKNEHPALGAGFIPIGVYVNNKLVSSLVDENGMELTKNKYRGVECYFIDLEPGQEKTLSYSWTAESNSVELVGAINIEPNARKYPETTYEDNKITEKFAPAAYDIAIKIRPLKTNWVIPDNSVLVESTVTVRRKDNFPGTLPVKVTINGPGGPKVHTLNLGPKEIKQYPYNFNAGPGTYTINAEAWPANDSWTDVYPQDNKDSVTITVKKMDLPETDGKIRVGL
uniref:PQQ-binding-like beta-propeller repeat protein n=1 Tax=Desulfofalx alkaliphila TaxID=105483 RepID=UPI001A9A5D79